MGLFLSFTRGEAPQTHNPLTLTVYSAASHGKTWITASKLGGIEWVLMYPASTNAE